MGGQVSSPSIPPDVLRSETEVLMAKSGCSVEMERELNREIEIMMVSLHPDHEPVPAPTLILNKKTLDPRFEQEVKAVLLDRIDEFELHRQLEERFYDANLLSVIGCLYGNFLISDKEVLEATASAKNYFMVTDNLSIGQWGIVLRAKNGGSDMSFIVKTQTNPNDRDMTIHEAFVAMACTNNLRAFCPNFSYLYGGFVCGKLDGVNAKICTGKQQVPYTVYENVPGSNFDAFLRTIPPSPRSGIRPAANLPPLEPSYLVVLSTLLQMFFALKIAHAKAYQFSHKDLHAGNIVLRPLKTAMVLKYDSRHFVLDDPIDKVMRKAVSLPPKVVPEGPRDVFYVKSNYVATVIDYDMAEVYLPYRKHDGQLGIRRHGIPDRDPVDHIVSDDPAVSHIRDLAKLLGFTANAVLNQNVSNEFKELMCDLYIDTIRPYYTILSPTAQSYDVQQKVNLIVRDAQTRFSVTTGQVNKIREGVVTFDRFLDNFTRLVPAHYVAEIIARQTIDPSADLAFETHMKQQLGLDVLGCRENCATQVQAYHTLTDPAYGRETESIAAVYKQRPEILSFQIMDSYRSTVKFQNSPIKMDNDEYRQLIAQRASEFAKLATPAILRSLDSTVKIQSELLRRLIGVISLPDPKLFPRDVKLHRNEIHRYKVAINILFDIVKKMREIIIIHNSTVVLNSPFAKLNRPTVVQLNGEVNTFLNQIVFPWRDAISQLARSKAFGPATGEMKVIILTKLPSEVTFDPIF